MIARIWHGRTKIEDYEAYTEFMKDRAIPDYQNTKGFIKLVFLRNISENIGHFTLITFWESLEVIKNFAGEDFEKAKYYPEDKNYLLEFEEKVTHHEVFAES
jgi:heme-degrading monooxygenase HmoA